MNSTIILNQAIQLRSEQKLTESNLLLHQLASEFPEDAYIQYQCAWSFDCLGEETKAVPHYEAAIKGDLKDQDLQSAYLGLGSTYRALGDYENSKRIFVEGTTKFPENHALKAFYAMTLYNLNEHNKAMRLLLKTLIETTKDEDIKSYEKALTFYADHLDETWN